MRPFSNANIHHFHKGFLTSENRQSRFFYWQKYDYHLALQNYIIGCFKLYFKSIIEYGGYATNIILTLLTIIICCLPIKLINSYVPFLVGRGPYFEKKLK